MSALFKQHIKTLFGLFLVLFLLTSIATVPLILRNDNAAYAGDEGGGEGGQVAVESCESSGEFSFALCPILRISHEAIIQLDARIRSAMEVNPAFFEPPPNADVTSTNPVRDIWGNFRNIAAILLIPILLTLVIGTALGFSFIDAYTVKRAMPRLFIAVIFMVLSYDICLLMVDLTTALGRGVGGLVAIPFGGADQLTLANLFTPPGEPPVPGFIDRTVGVIPGVDGLRSLYGVGTGILAIIAVAGTGGGVGLLSIGILASFFLTAAFLLMIIFIILAIRELVIVMLVVVSPLAILSWIFPGNDKLWKIWWETFTKLLMVYPVIFALLMIGRGFAHMINTIGTGAELSNIEKAFFIITKLGVYIGPFFLLLIVLKILTGAFGSFTGMANDRGRGILDKQKNYRKGQRETLNERANAGNRYNGAYSNSAVARTYNRGVQSAMIVGTGKAGKDPRKILGRLNEERSMRDTVEAAKAKENEKVKMVINNDDLLDAALAGDRTQDAARAHLEELGMSGRELEQNLASIEVARSSVGARTFDEVAAVANAGTGTGYAQGPAQMIASLNSVAGGDRSKMARMLAEARGNAGQAGRVDLNGNSFGDTMQVAQFMHEQGIQGPTRDDEQGIPDNGWEYAQNRMISGALDGKSAGAIAGQRLNSFMNMVPAITDRINTSQQNVDGAAEQLAQARADRAASDTEATAQAEIDAYNNFRTRNHEHKRNVAQTIAFQDIAAQVAPENARVIGGNVLSQVAGRTYDYEGNAVDVGSRMNRPMPTNAAGQPVLDGSPTHQERPRLLDVAEHLRGDAEFQRYRREYAADRNRPTGTEPPVAGAVTGAPT